jgi:hypothetical protein
MMKFIVSGILQSVCKGTAGDMSNFGSLQLESLAVTSRNTILHGAHVAFTCSVWMSEQTAALINIGWFCITEVERVYCAVRTETLYKTGKFRL